MTWNYPQCHQFHLQNTLATSPASAHHQQTIFYHSNTIAGNHKNLVILLIFCLNFVVAIPFKTLVFIHHLIIPYVTPHSHIYQLCWTGIKTHRLSKVRSWSWQTQVWTGLDPKCPGPGPAGEWTGPGPNFVMNSPKKSL